MHAEELLGENQISYRSMLGDVLKLSIDVASNTWHGTADWLANINSAQNSISYYSDGCV